MKKGLGETQEQENNEIFRSNFVQLSTYQNFRLYTNYYLVVSLCRWENATDIPVLFSY
jgi:hypothetical protein